MSTEPKRNVYVGHRYVPLISGEWDKQQTYEGLSIVTHKGNSYTSKKRVPIGIEIDDTEYWVVTGNYDLQVEQYRQEVRNVEKYVDDEIQEVDTRLNENIAFRKKLVVTPFEFGAMGNGLVDDTVALQNAIIEAEKHNATLDGLGGTFQVSHVMGVNEADSVVRNKGLSITKSITIKNMNLFLRNNSDDFTTPLNVYSPTSHVITIENVTIDGNRNNQRHSTPSQDGGMHGIRINGDGETTGYIQIKDSIIKNCESDGLLFSSITPDMSIIEGCIFNNNSRNGFTDNALENMIVRDCQFLNSNGSLPESGYHCEPDHLSTFRNRLIENCVSKGNANFGFRFDVRKGQVQNITIKECITDKDIGFVMASTDGNPRHNEKITIENCEANTIVLSFNTTQTDGTGQIKDNVIRSCRAGVITVYANKGIAKNTIIENCVGRFNLHGSHDTVRIKGTTIVTDKENVRGIDGNVFTNPTTNGYVLKNIFIDGLYYENSLESITGTGIDIRGDLNENIKITNSTFKTVGHSIYLRSGDKVVISGNTFLAKGDNVQMVRGETATNILYMNNILVPKKLTGEPATGLTDNLPSEGTIKENNMTIV